ncbi:MAG: hypothetical protein QOK88_07945 [Nitrososphaeraceae archaeon]|jgi:hypothetical protein|nr:hypothetical protein [Nitrososphaeraceae archaeon]MDW0135415.1 hypothetical protein [Nitrososphaeraceae archaeon]MDW0155013.1 hypothetical protein [Nitrososphaeraceae archaeon]
MKIHNTRVIFSMLSTISVFVGISLLMTEVFAQQGETGTNIESPQFLAIQHAQSGTISDINSTSYTLQLNDLADKTILFSDRPNRIVVTETTRDFVGNWTSGEDSFQVDPPNAALVVTDDQEDDVFEIELFNPTYDEDENAIRYDFSVLGNATSSPDLPPNLGKSVLIIDSSESKWPLQYSGD